MSNQTWQVADADPSNDSKVNVAKAYFGANTEKLSSNAYMLSGISSMNSNLSVRIVNNTALLSALNSIFIANYDAIIKYNVATRQVVVLK
jgi:outer membrane cobalamin receptor